MLKDMLHAVRNGFTLLFAESRWAFTQACRKWEIRQLEKRLNEECRNLGRSYADAQAGGKQFDPRADDNDLSLRQIGFLKEEISYLEDELSAARKEFLQSRRDGQGAR